ncbi:hypothetical protein [Pedobacter africanus]|uniref:Uncharacterized protein n=1 Tax=Pedobacter africanus TaxID=151894 RepID=A0A1W2CX81_9SPHI|nr:hypothetical protein [Pedobacter africanus]SMC89841.1 hypothetical protein SAMN04488524_3368 [Pedobacter africanus]
MKKLIIIAIACYGLSARAQSGESKNFIYLYSDSVIHARNITLRPDAFGSWQLRVDSRRIPPQQVKFFSNRNGFFANTRRLNFAGITAFSERVIEGRINLYQQTSYEPGLYNDYHHPHHQHYSSRQPVDIRMYYNKGFSDLQKVNYHNLKLDMADHPESMDLLAGYRRSMSTGKLMYVAAGAAIAAGIVSFLVGTEKSSMAATERGYTAGFALIGAGAGLAFGGYAVSAKANRHLEDAIEAYNR